MVKMKLFISAFSWLLFVNLSHAWNPEEKEEETTLLCEAHRLARLKEMVKDCWDLAYVNFLEEKLVMVDDFTARCDYLNYKVNWKKS